MLETVYLVSTIFFGGILIVSFVLGEIFEGVGEVVESAGNVVEGWIEAFTGFDIELTGDIAIGGGFGLVQSLLVFFTFSSGGGYLALTRWDTSEGWSVVIGLLFGIAGGGIALATFQWLAAQEATGARAPNAYVGLSGIVTIGIRLGKFGAISVTGPMGVESLTAQAEESILTGTPVRIVSMQAGVAHVEPQQSHQSQPQGR